MRSSISTCAAKLLLTAGFFLASSLFFPSPLIAEHIPAPSPQKVCTGEVKDASLVLRCEKPGGTSGPCTLEDLRFDTYTLTWCETTAALTSHDQCPSPDLPPGNIQVSRDPLGTFESFAQWTLTKEELLGQDNLRVFIKGAKSGKTFLGFALTQFLPSQPWEWNVRAAGEVFFSPFQGSELFVNPTVVGGINFGGGTRIFPERKFPQDTTDRSTVQVNTECGNPGSTMYFKAFDVDDPSSDSGPVDSTGPSGVDNRGTPQNGTLSTTDRSGATSSILSVSVDSSRAARALFRVTQHPGDNFVIAASDNLEYLRGVTVEGTGLKDADGSRLPTDKAGATELLTVWRRLHIEADRMGNITNNGVTGSVTKAQYNKRNNQTEITVSTPLESERFENGLMRIVIGTTVTSLEVVTNSSRAVTVPGLVQPSDVVGKGFSLVDDDDYNSDDTLLLDGDSGEEILPDPGITFSLIQDSDDRSKNVFAPAFIRPIIDGGGDPAGNTGVPFSLNFQACKRNCGDCDHVKIEAQVDLGRNLASKEGDDFWVTDLQLAYQSDTKCDGDPETEYPNPLSGLTSAYGATDSVTCPANTPQPPFHPQGGQGSLIFLETAKDVSADRALRVVPHELGHQFGLRGDTQTGLGLMSYSEDEPLELVPAHINILRCRVKSPGQP